MLNNIALSQDEQQIIIGGLLGDANIQKNNNQIRFYQSIKQKEYLKWKYSFFAGKNYVTDLKVREYKSDTRYPNGFSGIGFSVKNPNHLLDDFYSAIRKKITDKNNNKKITIEYLNYLTPLGLAVWWMDDGCLSIHDGNRYGKLCTHGFSYEEHLIIQTYFKEMWDIDVQIKVEKNKYYFCRLNVENLKKLITLIYPYVTQVKSMIYKIDLNYKSSSYIGDFSYVYNYIKKCS